MALDPSGETLHADIAPDDFGALFLPEPIYYRTPMGIVTGFAAITWVRLTSPNGTAWAIGGRSDRDDRDKPEGRASGKACVETRMHGPSSAPTCSPTWTSFPVDRPIPAPDRPDVA